MTIPPSIVAQLDEIRQSDLCEAEIRQFYPGVIGWFLENISLVDLVTASGVALRPISPDEPNILVGDCPGCGGPILVQS